MFIKIAWTAPSNNHVAIDAYQILIITSLGTYVEDTTNCNGADSLVLANMYCLVQMSVLQASPYSLILGDLIAAEVLAHNARGWSIPSLPNTSGSQIQTVPSQMAAPTSGSTTSSTQIQIDWVALTSTATGNSAILSYQLYWD